MMLRYLLAPFIQTKQTMLGCPVIAQIQYSQMIITLYNIERVKGKFMEELQCGESPETYMHGNTELY